MKTALYSRLAVSALLLSALLTWAEASSPAKSRYDELVSAMRQAREHKDWQTYLANAGQLQQFLNGAPITWLNLARGELHTGSSEKALRSVGHFVSMGQSADLLLNSSEFAVLRDNPKFAAIRERMAANDSPVANSTLASDIAELGLVAEDIDYDPHSHKFFVTSIQKKKIISIDAQGNTTDFAVAPDGWPMMALKIDAQRRVMWATEVALKDFTSVAKSDWGKSIVLGFDLDRGALLYRIEGPPDSALGDMVLLRNGDPLISDGQGGGVYRLLRATQSLERVDDGSFLSPQTPALFPDGRHVFVPDYLRGIGVLDLTTKQVRWIPMEDKYALNGIDGLYFSHGSLMVTQNGTSPERVITFKLEPSLSAIASSSVVERATKTLGDPTHGVIVGHDFYYIANSGWDTLNDDGTVKSDAKLTPVHIMRVHLNCDCRSKAAHNPSSAPAR
ncbi:MAG: hypothetical protein WA655_12625 [Candidatus Korobacteraceae bacterium]